LSLTFSPTPSKVARRGAKKPYPIPPKKLPTIPTTGQSNKGTGNIISTTTFKTSPNLFVLLSKAKQFKSELRTFETHNNHT
jgi:hypothetical protein